MLLCFLEIVSWAGGAPVSDRLADYAPFRGLLLGVVKRRGRWEGD